MAKRKTSDVLEESALVISLKKNKVNYEPDIVTAMWTNPDLYYEYDNITMDDFTSNIWRVYFIIGKECIKEGAKKLTPYSVAQYLEKHPKLKGEYERNNGFELIEEGKEYSDIENFERSINELTKWKILLDLAQKNFLTEETYEKIKDCDIEEIYNYFESMVNNTFIKAETTVKAYNACEGLDEIIEDCDKGLEKGLPINNSPQVDENIAGLQLGQTYLVGAQSGVGKTTFTLQLPLQSILEAKEQCVIFINEQDEKKIKKELLTFVANNRIRSPKPNADRTQRDKDIEGKIYFKKKRFKEGNFTPEEKDLLNEAKEYLAKLKNNKSIMIIPLETYTVDIVKKLICKYSAMGIKYFFLDTFKESANAKGEAWQSMMRDMRELYDLVKPANKNVFLWCTMQLTKANARYLTANSIGLAKNMPDTTDVCMLMRKFYPDEYTGDNGQENRHQIHVRRREGKTEIPVACKKEDGDYFLLFTEKNRNGESRNKQIVFRNDLSKNIYEEIGYAYVNPDF